VRAALAVSIFKGLGGLEALERLVVEFRTWFLASTAVFVPEILAGKLDVIVHPIGEILHA